MEEEEPDKHGTEAPRSGVSERRFTLLAAAAAAIPKRLVIS